MADDRIHPSPGPSELPRRAVRPKADRCGRLDMSAFEKAYAEAPAQGPQQQWAILWPDGRTMAVDCENDALMISQLNPSSRVVRRYVGPWSQWEPPPEL